MTKIYCLSIGFFLLTSVAVVKSQPIESIIDSALHYQTNHQFDKAINYLQQVLENNTDKLSQETKMEIWQLIGHCHNELGNLNEAVQHLQLAVQTSSKVYGNNSLQCAMSYLELVELFIEYDVYEQAYTYIQEAESILIELGDTQTERYADLLYFKALTLQYFEDYQLAEKLFKESATIIAKTLGEQDFKYWNAIYALGSLYIAKAAYEDAIKVFQQVKSGYELHFPSDSISYSNVLNELGLSYYYLGKYRESELLLINALDIVKKQLGSNDISYAITLNNIANLYLDMGRTEKAIEAQLHVKNLLSNSPLGKNHPYYAVLLNNLAISYESLRSYDKSIVLLKESKDLINLNRGKNINYAITVRNLASNFLMNNQPDSVSKYLGEALHIINEKYGSNSTLFAQTLLVSAKYNSLSNPNKGNREFSKALQILKNNFGTSHLVYIEALTNYTESLINQKAYKEANDNFQIINSNYLRFIQNHFNILTEKEREQLYEKIKTHFEKYASFCKLFFNQNPDVLVQLFDFRINTKAKLLESSRKFKQSIINSGDSELIHLYKEWEKLRQQIARSYQLSEFDPEKLNLDSMSQKAEALEKKLSISNNDQTQETSRIITFSDIKNSLQTGDVAVELIRHRQYNFMTGTFTNNIIYSALIVRHNSKFPEYLELPSGESLEKKYFQLYRNSIKFKLEDTDSYNRFWSSLENRIGNSGTIYLSADGIYHQVNINTLKNKAGQFVLETTNLKKLTSLKEVISKKDKSLASHAVLIGNPQFSTTTYTDNSINQPIRSTILVPLPGAEKEVNEIKQILNEIKWTQTVHTGNSASEDAVKKLNNPTVLHIATHGYFDAHLSASLNVNPLLNSGILLTNAGDTYHSLYTGKIPDQSAEDGILTAYEATSLKLDKTDLVVLSACETGLGQIASGEGVYGLQRAFKVAGTSEIMMSLWKVDDQTTQELMVEFYKNWLLHSMDKTQAFKSAQLKIKNKYEHPYYWGAFELVGM